MKKNRIKKFINAFSLIVVILLANYFQIDFYVNILNPSHNYKIYSIDDFNEDENNELIKNFAAESYNLIGLNILTWTSDYSDHFLIDQLEENWHAYIKRVLIKQDLISEMQSDKYDCVILLNYDNEYDGKIEDLIFNLEELNIIKDFVENGGVLICSDTLIKLNPQICEIVGIEKFEYSPYLPNVSFSSNYYLVKQFFNETSEISNGGFYIKPLEDPKILARHEVWKPPVIKIVKEVNVSEISSEHCVKISLNISNIGQDIAYDISINEYLNGFTILKSNLAFIYENENVIWNIDKILPGHTILIEFECVAPIVEIIQNFELYSDIEYFDDKSRKFVYPDVALLNYYNCPIIPPIISIKVRMANILAWCDDATDELLIKETLDNRCSYIMVEKVNDLLFYLNSSEFDILWLMNFGWIDFSCNFTKEEFLEWFFKLREVYTEFGEKEARIIKEWVRKGGKIIASDWALKLWQISLNQLFGIMYLGGIPPIFLDINEPYQWDGFEHDQNWECESAGCTWRDEERSEWDWYHLIHLSNEYPINYGFWDSFIKSKSWAFDIHLYNSYLQKICPEIAESETLAHFCRPCEKFGKIILEDQPAIISSTFEKGRGVYFSPDIGHSVYKGYNSSEWINICINSLKWLSFLNKSTITASNKEFVIPEPYLSYEFISLALNEELPSILYNQYGYGRVYYFTFDVGLESLLNIDCTTWKQIIQYMCYRMIYYENLEEFGIDENNNEVSYYFTAYGKSIISIVTEDLQCSEGILYIDGEEIKDLDPNLNFTDIFYEFDSGEHEIKIVSNKELNYFNGFRIKAITIQHIFLIHQCFESPIDYFEMSFKGSGYLQFIYQFSGSKVEFFIDNILIDQFIPPDNDIQSNLNSYSLKSGEHTVKIQGINLLIYNFSVITGYDCDQDEIASGDEFIIKSPIFQQNPWIFWESLVQDFEIKESNQAGVDLKYSYYGRILLVIPSEFNNSELYLKIDSLSNNDYISDLKIIDITIYDRIDSVGTYLLADSIESDTYTIHFNFIEIIGNGNFDIELLLKLDDTYISPLTIENSLYADSDGDGLTDSIENARNLDPNNPDIDLDFVFDGLDYSKKNYDVLQGNSLHEYSFKITDEFKTQNLRIGIQIQRPTGNELYERESLPWIEEGTIDIVPLLRIIGPYDCEGLHGDYLPNDMSNNISNYIAIVPLIDVTEYSYQTYFTYYSNESQIHPAFSDGELNLVFDFVWGALLTNSAGDKSYLHLWPHPHDVLIQGVELYHFSSMNGVLLRVSSEEEQDYIYAGYIIESQWGYETNYQASNVPEELNGGIYYFEISNPGELSNEVFNGVDIFPDYDPEDVYVLALELNKTYSVDGLIEKLTSSIIKKTIKVVTKVLIEKIGRNIIAKKFTFGATYGFRIAKPEIINRISVTAIFSQDASGQWVLTFSKQSGTIIETIDGTWSYRASQTKLTADGGLDVIETRIYVNAETNQYQIVEYYRHYDTPGGEIKFREKRITTDWTDIQEGRVYDLDDTLETPLKKSSILQKGLAVVQVIMGIWQLIDSIITLVQACQTFLIGCQLIELGGDFFMAGVLITIGSLFIIISAVISIGVAIIDIAYGIAFIAGITSSTGIGLKVGLILFAITLVLLLIGWLLILFGQNAIPDYDTPGLDIITEGSRAPKIYLDESTLDDVYFKLSPEVGCGLTFQYYFFNPDNPDITDEAYIQQHVARLTFGDNSYGPKNPETKYWNDNVFGINHPAQKVTTHDTCNTWGPNVDAILQIKYQFYDDGISGAAYYYIPLDLDISVFPSSIQEFIAYLENYNPYSKTKEAVTIHLNTDGEMDFEGNGDRKYAQVGPTKYGPWYSLYATNDPYSGPGYIKSDSGAYDTWQAGFVPENRLGYVRIYNEETNGDNNYDDWQFDKAAYSWNGNNWEWDTIVIRDWYKDLFGNVYYEDRVADYFNFGDGVGLYGILDTNEAQPLYRATRTDGFTLIRHSDNRFHWYHY
ncbi:MAG: thrombospondin type 3 repeat-containing protein [Candidatus Thorarchaeota archaeon]